MKTVSASEKQREAANTADKLTKRAVAHAPGETSALPLAGTALATDAEAGHSKTASAQIADAQQAQRREPPAQVSNLQLTQRRESAAQEANLQLAHRHEPLAQESDAQLAQRRESPAQEPVASLVQRSESPEQKLEAPLLQRPESPAQESDAPKHISLEAQLQKVLTLNAQILDSINSYLATQTQHHDEEYYGSRVAADFDFYKAVFDPSELLQQHLPTWKLSAESSSAQLPASSFEDKTKFAAVQLRYRLKEMKVNAIILEAARAHLAMLPSESVSLILQRLMNFGATDSVYRAYVQANQVHPDLQIALLFCSRISEAIASKELAGRAAHLRGF